MSRYYRSFLEESGPSYTARTNAFAAATSITDTTILNALNTFDLGLISNGLDTKMIALYPFVGGTATTHKYNFMDARDLDVAFKLNFYGGYTHNSNGITANGTNAYAQANNLTLNYFNTNYKTTLSFGIYSKTDSAGCDLSATTAGGDGGIELWSRSGGSMYHANQDPQSGGAVAVANSFGFNVSNRIGNIKYAIKNGSVISTINSASYTYTQTTKLTLHSFYNGTAYFYYSNKNIALTFAANSLTNAEQTTFYSLVQAMQTLLSRNV